MTPATGAPRARHLIISGLVQGVGYRYSMVAEARRLGVTGWVRNRRDGRKRELFLVARSGDDGVVLELLLQQCGG